MTEDFILEGIARGTRVEEAMYRNEIAQEIAKRHPARTRKNKDNVEIAYMTFGSHEFAIGIGDDAIAWQLNRLVDIEIGK